MTTLPIDLTKRFERIQHSRRTSLRNSAVTSPSTRALFTAIKDEIKKLARSLRNRRGR
jgi:hypothetical protein